MSAWPTWTVGDTAALRHYVRTDVFAALLPEDLAAQLPGPGSAPRLQRANAAFDVLSHRLIRYVHEPSESSPGRQEIRPPDQVLYRPREGTCVDLALTYAGICLRAGLHPLIALLHAGNASRPGHAVVIVWLDGDWLSGPAADRPWQDGVEAAALLDDVRAHVDEPGAFIAVDVVGCTNEHPSFHDAVTTGFAILGDDWARVSIADIGSDYRAADAYPMPEWPARVVLSPPYHDRDAQAGPLTQIQARRGEVPFVERDELEILQHWTTETSASPVRITIVHGAGGSGKTRLAAELAWRLSEQGWYSGFLIREPSRGELRWLAGVAAPLLVVIDYAEAKTGDIATLATELVDRGQTAALVLTARTLGEWWTSELSTDLESAGIAYTFTEFSLPERHSRPAAVLRTALRGFGAAGDAATFVVADPKTGRRWTTLDLILVAWLRAHGDADPPGSRAELYDRVLTYEFRYWRKTGRERGMAIPPKDVLRAAAACLSLLTPEPERVEAILAAVQSLHDKPDYRQELGILVSDLALGPAEGTVAVRPDPIADQLIATELTRRSAGTTLLSKALAVAEPHERETAVVTLTRTAGADADAASRLAYEALQEYPDLWRAALEVASAVGGPFVGALREAAIDTTTLPIKEMADQIPLGHSSFGDLALTMTKASEPASTASDTDEKASLARWHNNMAIRSADTGQRSEALRHAVSAVDLWRALNDTVYRADLALALNTLAIRLQDADQPRLADAPLHEAVDHYRDLAAADPAIFLPRLAMALSNSANLLAELGESRQALASVREAIEHYESTGVADVDHRVDFATALDTLATRLSEAGDSSAALEPALRATDIRRQLAAKRPAIHLTDYAASLSNLGAHLLRAGHHQAALSPALEGVELWRASVESNPTRTRDLAIALTSLSNALAANNQRSPAIEAAREVVELYRALHVANPRGMGADVAGALNNLAIRLHDDGALAAAQDAAQKSVDLYRTVVENRPEYLRELAATLCNQAVFLAPDSAAALQAAREALDIYRALDDADAQHSHRAQFAEALLRLANRHGDAGRHVEGAALAEESVDIYRTLAADHPRYFPHLATALDAWANRLAMAGRHGEALPHSQQATEIRRSLASRDADAFLPDLVGSLSNQATLLAELGSPEPALRLAEEAERACRALYAADPDRHRLSLAATLETVATRRVDADNHSAALSVAVEAVDLYRTLLVQRGTSIVAGLANALATLAHTQAVLGDQTGAQRNATEAIDLRRKLARENPMAHLASLATILGTMAYSLVRSGEYKASLRPAREAVKIRRKIAADNPEAGLSQLATALNNLANHQSDSGYHQAALRTAREAVSIRRNLAQANPEANLRSLATALINLGSHQIANGRGGAAWRSIAEGTRIRCDLAHAQPDLYAEPLLHAFDKLTAHPSAGCQKRQAVIDTYEQAVAEQPAGITAQLLLHRGRWLTSLQLHDDAVSDFIAARHLAETETDPERAGRARRAVRFAAAADAQLRPSEGDGSSWTQGWPTVPLKDEITESIVTWLNASSWPMREQWVRTHPECLDRDFSPLLAVWSFVHPDAPGTRGLRELLDEVERSGLDATLNGHRADSEHKTLLGEWLSTPSWAESQTFARTHPQLLSNQRTLAILRADSSNPVLVQHAAIAELSETLALEDIYDAIGEVEHAAALSIRLLETGDVRALMNLFTAAPRLRHVRFVSPYIGAVILAVTDSGSDEINPTMMIQQASETGTATERRAGAIRLRRLAATVYHEKAHVLGKLASVLDVGDTRRNDDAST